MDAADMAAEASAAITKTGWEAFATGDTSAADAYWAAANLIDETFRKVTP